MCSEGRATCPDCPTSSNGKSIMVPLWQESNTHVKRTPAGTRPARSLNKSSSTMSPSRAQMASSLLSFSEQSFRLDFVHHVLSRRRTAHLHGVGHAPTNPFLQRYFPTLVRWRRGSVDHPLRYASPSHILNRTLVAKGRNHRTYIVAASTQLTVRSIDTYEQCSNTWLYINLIHHT